MMDKISKWLFGLFIVLIPWQTRWIFYEAGGEYGRLSIYGSWLVLIAVGLLIFLRQKPKIKITRDWFFYVIIAFILLNCLMAMIPAVAFYYAGLIMSAVLFGFIARKFTKIWLIYIFLTSGLIQGVVAVWQFWAQKVPASKWLGWAEHLPQTLGDSVVAFQDQRILRAYGALTHPNVLGGFLFVTIFVGLYLWIYFYKKQTNQKWPELIFITITMLVCTYALLASFSRSAVLALLIGLFCAVVINILKRDWLTFKVILKYIIIFALVFFSFNLLYPGAWSSRIQADDRLEVKSTTERLDTFQQLSFDNPKNILLGQGLGQNTFVTDGNQPIHNIFVLYLAETGIIGCLILLFVLFRIFKSNIKPDILSTSLILGLLVIGMFDHYLWTSWTGVLLGSLGVVSLYKT